jgi:chromosome segregation ATPase
MVTAEQRADAIIRLEALVSEYAAASQKAEATAKLHAIVELLPAEDSASDADASEIAALQTRLTELLADNDLLAHNLAAAEAKVTTLEGELAQARAAASPDTTNTQ